MHTISIFTERGVFPLKVTSQEYQRMNKKASPKSPVLKNCLWAIFVGGLICTLGQVITDLCQNAGLKQMDARLVGSVSLIFISMVLTGFNVYDNIAKHALRFYLCHFR